ncbi:MAG: type II toxin-antitoxin system ParD family antitoxin [Chloroflexia bacterium]|nr:type II toxin-antitoxin system ParD family antitoxin [Chloroflexia bacterium]
MARNTSVSLGDHFAGFVDEQVDSGRYGSASDVLRAGLRMLETHEQQLAWLRAKMADAEAQVKVNNVHEDSEQFWTDLDKEVDDRLRRGEKPDPDVCP